MSAIDWPNKKMPDEASKDLTAAELGERILGWPSFLQYFYEKHLLGKTQIFILDGDRGGSYLNRISHLGQVYSDSRA